jgi:hypothetical protein
MCLALIKALSEAWLAVWTTLLALFTLGVVYYTRKLFVETREAAKKQLGVNTWLHFISRWDSIEIRNRRKHLAAQIKDHEDFADSDPVLDFFEQVGTVYRLECLDKELAYSSLSHDAEHWWKALGGYVIDLRTKMRDKSVYDEFENMVTDLHAKHPNDPPVTSESLDEYLKGEMEL